MNILFLNIGQTELLFLIGLPLIVYIFSVFHAFKNKNLDANQRLLWIIIILVAPLLGLALYWINGVKAEKKIKNA